MTLHPPSRLARIGWIGLFTGIYFIIGKFGLMLAYAHPSASAVWPGTGLSLAALLLAGYWLWPGIFVGAFFVNLTTAGNLATSLGIATGNTLEGLVGAWLVNEFANGRNAFDSPRHIVKFLVLAGLVGTMVSATVGVTSLTLGGFARWSDAPSLWLTWWWGDAVGALVMGPLLLLWSQDLRVRWSRRQLLEAVLLLAALFLVGQVVFGGLAPGINNQPLEFLAIPILVWAGFRFGLRETATVIFLLSCMAVWGTVHGFGPFVRESPDASLLVLQAFMGVMGLMALTLAAVVAQQKRSEEARLQLLTRERQARAEAEAKQQRIVTLLESMTEMFVALDHEWRISYLNRSVEGLLKKMGRTRDGLVGKNLWELFPGLLDSTFYQECHRAMAERMAVKFEQCWPPMDAWFEVRIYPSEKGLSIYAQDITEQKAQTTQLEYRAMHDPLTRLPNRRLFYDRFQQALLAGEREAKPVSLLMVDLNHFKEINDTFGHQGGDLLLREAGLRLQSTLRDSDTAARLGGDEFAIVLSNTDAEGAGTAARKVLGALETPIQLEKQSVTIGASIGIALYPDHGNEISTLLRRADHAMYAAKRERCGYLVYFPGLTRLPSGQLTVDDTPRTEKKPDQ
ncbi:MAG: MASE1 domain-containing protein [Nitrospirae bacterium]|nr:MASE1 domain-containing protein [Nitrospirota bacterium]